MNGDLHECPNCDGDGFLIETCGCREAHCPHEWFLPRQSEKADGVYQKFWVRRTDGESSFGCKHYECEYFVLDLDHDPYAAAAVAAYASACDATHPGLARDLRLKLKGTEEG